MSEKKDCYNCAYRNTIPGNAHSRCVFNWSKSELNPPKVNQHGVRSGWYMFPFNFDPVWQEEECVAHSTIKDDNMIAESNPLNDLISLMKRGL